MPSTLAIHYLFHFQNGKTLEIPILLEAETLELIPTHSSPPPSWAVAVNHTCKNCPLDATIHQYCPTAIHLGWILDQFAGHHSYEEVSVEVIDSMRHYSKSTSLQDALGSLLGIVMPTAGCPLLKPLRPMVRFHLPFASLEEMEFRMVSMYLFAQYLRHQGGGRPDWTLEGLQEIYERVNEVNRSFSNRIRAAFDNDAGVNAIIILDCFAQTIPKAIQNMMRDFRKYFTHYMQADNNP